MNPKCSDCDLDMLKTDWGYVCPKCGDHLCLSGRERALDSWLIAISNKIQANIEASTKAGNNYYFICDIIAEAE